MTINIQPLELFTTAEAARRLGVCGVTLKRRLTQAGITPDAFALGGGNRVKSMLFVQPRLGELAKVMGVSVPNQ